MKKIIPLLVLSTLLSVPAGAGETKSFLMDCFAGNDQGETLGEAHVVVAQGESYTILEKDGFTFQGSVSPFVAEGENTYELVLTILKDGKMAAQSLTDFDLAKTNSANLYNGPEFRSLSCVASLVK